MVEFLTMVEPATVIQAEHVEIMKQVITHPPTFCPEQQTTALQNIVPIARANTKCICPRMLTTECRANRANVRKLPHHLTITIFKQSRAIIRTNDLTKFNELLSFKPNKDIIGTHFLNMFHGNQAINVTYNMALDGRKDGRTDRRTTPKQYPSADGGG
ncbi:hypothetical protein DPMN_112322 [Dreissena polymorpha]|uniref:Uncharacterized protein n=1 Tax=Dreissena polymorpha TaxID=45954 RepID=A0A9D4QQS3_DREPO|nr:hypothetical protein DPMN_112322 [Dreissena polymorpha]